MSSITKAVSRYSAVRYINILNKNATGFRIKQRISFHTSSFFNVVGLEIKMPSLSPTMSEGKIVKWLKKEGDTINPGDVLCDIETDKAIMSMETEEEGILAKILVPENSKSVNVGSLIALMVQPGENWREVEMRSEASGAPSQPPPVSKGADPTQSSGPVSLEVKMPSLSPTMTMGTILKWHKKEGEAIAAGDVLCDIQTDKAVISFETDEEGILAKILVQEDTKDVNVGTLIALIVGDGEDWKNVVVPQQSRSPSAEAQAQVQTQEPETSVSVQPGKLLGPAARALLSVYQLNPNSIKATGRNNVLLKEDVLKYIEENRLQKKPPKTDLLPSAPAQASPPVSKSAEVPKPPKPDVAKDATPPFGRRTKVKFVDIELSNIRRVIARRLTDSKQSTPHCYGRVTCQVDELLSIRKEMSSIGITASLNDYIIKATAMALQSCPRVNVICVNEEYKQSPTIDIAVAVATPSGLITPIITDVARKSVMEISETIKEMAPRARTGRLKPHEFQGGSFTISNLGMFGIKHFTAIINPPQCAILAVGASIDRLGSDLKTHYDITFTLSYDRRALQEDEVAEFLEKLKFVIENPKQIVASNVSVKRALGL